MLGGFAMNNKLQGKDLINIGIFTAIYFIVIFAAASIGFIPIFIPLISVIVPLVGGIPMMLFFSKIKKFGMLTICGVLLGIIMLLAGMGWWCIPTGLIFGLISDFSAVEGVITGEYGKILCKCCKMVKKQIGQPDAAGQQQQSFSILTMDMMAIGEGDSANGHLPQGKPTVKGVKFLHICTSLHDG